jgi:predicted transcriptional regulator of viral defense system
MYKKYTTTLSAKELELIEKLIIEYGNVVDFNMIHRKISKNYNKQQTKNFISNLVKKGWLVRIKKGVFVISDISSRGSVNLSQLSIAQIIYENSYISFEAALQHYGLFDQYLRVITSVGKRRTYSTKFNNWVFHYIKCKKNLYSDYKEYSIDGRLVKIASKEKAILDFLIYRRNFYEIDLVIEKIKNYEEEFDINKLIEMSKNCSISVKRSLGVILDLIGIDSDELYKAVKDNKNYSLLTSESNKFNAKWRIYVDSKLID